MTSPTLRRLRWAKRSYCRTYRGLGEGLIVPVGTGVIDARASGPTGGRLATGVGETACVLFRIGTSVAEGLVAGTIRSELMFGCTLAPGLVAGAVVVPVWPVVGAVCPVPVAGAVCAEANDSAIRQIAAIPKNILFI
jgi:hypothetical protein